MSNNIGWGKGVLNEINWGQGADEGNNLLAENGNFFVTEDGRLLVTESPTDTTNFGYIYESTWSGETLLKR
jgi:hypothetical protein